MDIQSILNSSPTILPVNSNPVEPTPTGSFEGSDRTFSVVNLKTSQSVATKPSDSQFMKVARDTTSSRGKRKIIPGCSSFLLNSVSSHKDNLSTNCVVEYGSIPGCGKFRLQPTDLPAANSALSQPQQPQQPAVSAPADLSRITIQAIVNPSFNYQNAREARARFYAKEAVMHSPSSTLPSPGSLAVVDLPVSSSSSSLAYNNEPTLAVASDEGKYDFVIYTSSTELCQRDYVRDRMRNNGITHGRRFINRYWKFNKPTLESLAELNIIKNDKQRLMEVIGLSKVSLLEDAKKYIQPRFWEKEQEAQFQQTYLNAFLYSIKKEISKKVKKLDQGPVRK